MVVVQPSPVVQTDSAQEFSQEELSALCLSAAGSHSILVVGCSNTSQRYILLEGMVRLSIWERYFVAESQGSFSLPGVQVNCGMQLPAGG
mmetsp:Transcript_11509/g.20704  ORF Transcript_11509/g.20704 Transcript_11509/m.20704 type:complete len:90 (-) Transcript_11509:1985-2254(-)